MVNDVGVLDNTGIGGHEAVYIGPYLEHIGIEGCCKDGRGVIASATPEVGHITFGIGGYEARHERHLEIHVVKGLMHELLRGVVVEHMFAILVKRLDKLTRVIEPRILDYA